MGNGLTEEVDHLEILWNDWEIYGAIVLSLLIQILLLTTAGYRKRNYALQFKAVSISIFLWFEYLWADSVATFALSYLSHNQGQLSHLVIMWAPFLLLHLGGQDTITAMSIEDNELWKRHLLTFISHVGLAIYVFAKSGPPSSISLAASFIFIAGILKYAERIWALQKANLSSFMSSSSMATIDLLNNPNYLLTITRDTITINPDDAESPENGIKEDYAGVVCTAYVFSNLFKPIWVDSVLNYVAWTTSRRYFLRLQAEIAYKVIEVELSFMYDILHTKSTVLHKWYGWFFRLTTLICTIASLVIFTISNRIAYHKIEVGITYLLLVGAVVLETSALVFMLLSNWTYASLKKCNNCPTYKRNNPNCLLTNWLVNKLLFLTEKLRPAEKSRWSNSLGQSSLLNHVLQCKPTSIGYVMSFFGLKDIWAYLTYTNYKPVESQLKKLVFSELTKKIKSINNEAKTHGFSDHIGQISGTLRGEGCYEKTRVDCR